jgi:hypothetical protein
MASFGSLCCVVLRVRGYLARVRLVVGSPIAGAAGVINRSPTTWHIRTTAAP